MSEDGQGRDVVTMLDILHGLQAQPVLSEADQVRLVELVVASQSDGWDRIVGAQRAGGTTEYHQRFSPEERPPGDNETKASAPSAYFSPSTPYLRLPRH
jgi:hypothetical protein